MLLGRAARPALTDDDIVPWDACVYFLLWCLRGDYRQYVGVCDMDFDIVPLQPSGVSVAVTLRRSIMTISCRRRPSEARPAESDPARAPGGQARVGGRLRSRLYLASSRMGWGGSLWGLRFRRRLPGLAKGIYVNLSKSSSVSLGGRGATVNLSRRGTRLDGRTSGQRCLLPLGDKDPWSAADRHVASPGDAPRRHVGRSAGLRTGRPRGWRVGCALRLTADAGFNPGSSAGTAPEAPAPSPL